ncbi:MAG TPA: response regulator [Candidatus Dormibacteraeota bacterium]|nr:response regulator [Candidatus Dormibacteraeota bacterium]
MPNILLLEPDRLLAKTYHQALTGAGHRVAVCAGAQAAIMAADKTQPDLVILELQLIEHSGIEFLYEFRSYPEWQAVPVLIHSNVPPTEFADSWPILGRELGVDIYLYKPRTSLRQLTATVREQLPVPA